MIATQTGFQLHLPCDSQAPGKVRAELHRLYQIGSARPYAKLLASEMVTSVVLHADGRPAHMLDVVVEILDQKLRISVTDPDRRDHGSHVQGHSHRRTRKDADGLSLLLVDRLADQWGTTQQDGVVVWAEITL